MSIEIDFGVYRITIEQFQLVGHVIKGHGIAISGQEQRQLGGGFLEGEDAPAGEKNTTLARELYFIHYIITDFRGWWNVR